MIPRIIRNDRVSAEDRRDETADDLRRCRRCPAEGGSGNDLRDRLLDCAAGAWRVWAEDVLLLQKVGRTPLIQVGSIIPACFLPKIVEMKPLMIFDDVGRRPFVDVSERSAGSSVGLCCRVRGRGSPTR
jgi:hypothetical protein